MKLRIRFGHMTNLALLPLVAAVLFLPQVAAAGSLSLAWDPNTEPQLAGYQLHYGTASGQYSTHVDVGNVTTYTVSNLPAGTYYFSVTAYGSGGEQSAFSNEVSATLGVGCDINGDNSVNVVDLQALANVVLGINPVAGSDDLNGDGKVDVVDLQILINVILGLRSCP